MIVQAIEDRASNTCRITNVIASFETDAMRRPNASRAFASRKFGIYDEEEKMWRKELLGALMPDS